MTCHVPSHVTDLDLGGVRPAQTATRTVRTVFVKVNFICRIFNLPFVKFLLYTHTRGYLFLSFFLCALCCLLMFLSDIDECKMDPDAKCREGTFCFNTPGTFRCNG